MRGKRLRKAQQPPWLATSTTLRDCGLRPDGGPFATLLYSHSNQWHEVPLYVASRAKAPRRTSPETLGRLAEERYWRRHAEQRQWEIEADQEWGHLDSHEDRYRRRPWHPEYSRFDDAIVL